MKHSISAMAVLWLLMLNLAQSAEPLHRRVDQLIDAGAQGHAVAPLADDAEFLRRIYLDLAGCIPTVAEAKEFLADETPQKRTRLVDKLLEAPEYARRMEELFHAVLMERRGDHPGWRKFLRESFQANKPWNQLAREILTPHPADDASHGSAFFFAKRLEAYGQNSVDYPGLTRDVARMFLGVDLQCAQCHDHLQIADYKQVDFQGLFTAYQHLAIRTNAEFPNIVEKAKAEKLEFISVFESEKRATGPRVPFGVEFEVPPTADAHYSPVSQLGQGIPQADNTLFTRNIANRLWFIVMGRGLVHPLDLHHSGNPPSHPELLDLLASELAAHDFDMRWMLRQLVLSQTYQRSSRLPNEAKIAPSEAYAVGIQKGLSAEQLLWSTLQATGEMQRLTESQGTLVGAPNEKLQQLQKSFVKAFANPPGVPEVDYNATVQGALFLLNDREILGLLEPRSGNLVGRLSSLSDPKEVADELYLSILSRRPTAEEQAEVAAYLGEQADRRETALGWDPLESTCRHASLSIL